MIPQAVLAGALAALREAGLARDPRTTALETLLADFSSAVIRSNSQAEILPALYRFIAVRIWNEGEFTYDDMVQRFGVTEDVPASMPPLSYVLVRRRA